MRFLAVSWITLMVLGCSPITEDTAPPLLKATAVHDPLHGPQKPPAAGAPATPLESARVKSAEISGITFEGVAFDSRNHRLVVADQAGGPGTRFPDAAGAGGSRGGLAAVNAGFFTPEGEPLGLVVSAGKPVGAWNSASSLGSGIWFEDSSGQSAITRREKLGRSGALAMRELIQAGPMLVENHRAVSGLDALKASIRTVILWDGGTRWWIGRANACTLADLGAAIIAARPAGWSTKHALNLDGGRSSDLWISSKVPGGPVLRRPAWNRVVRNFLILAPR